MLHLSLSDEMAYRFSNNPRALRAQERVNNSRGKFALSI